MDSHADNDVWASSEGSQVEPDEWLAHKLARPRSIGDRENDSDSHNRE